MNAVPYLLRAFVKGRRGVAGIEAALAIGLVLLPLSLGLMDLGTELAAVARLDRALQSAVFYAWAYPGAFTTAGLQNAASAGYGSASPPVTVQTSTACSCVTNTYSPTASVACTGATCPTGQQVAGYTTITASISLPLPASLPGLSSPMPLSVQGTIRTR